MDEIYVITLMFVIVGGSLYGAYFVVRVFFEGMRSASDQVVDKYRDAHRKLRRLNRFISDFGELNAPERIVQELFSIVWMDVLWAVDVPITPSTLIEIVYSPKWVDAGQSDSVETKFRRRCGLPTESASIARTFGELITNTLTDLGAGKLAGDRILVRPTGPPTDDSLLQPSERRPMNSGKLLLRPSSDGLETLKGREDGC